MSKLKFFIVTFSGKVTRQLRYGGIIFYISLNKSFLSTVVKNNEQNSCISYKVIANNLALVWRNVSNLNVANLPRSGGNPAEHVVGDVSIGLCTDHF